MKRQPTIYIIDDDASVCRSLSLLLRAHGFKVATFLRADEFLTSKFVMQSSCLVLDIHLPDINGLELQSEMMAKEIFIPIIFITGQGNIPQSVKAMKGGAIDFLPKPFTEMDLLEAIDRAITKSKKQNKEQAEIAQIWRHIKTLTPREVEVFRLVASGMLNKQVALRLGTSLQTIKIHRSRVMHKMLAHTITELISFAQKVGLISPKKS